MITSSLHSATVTTHRIFAVTLAILAVTALATGLQPAQAAEAPTVLITGSNRGIGLELARQYAERGWNVIATARKPDPQT